MNFEISNKYCSQDFPTLQSITFYQENLGSIKKKESSSLNKEYFINVTYNHYSQFL